MSRSIRRSKSVSRGSRRYRRRRKDLIEDMVSLMLVGVLLTFCSLIIIRFSIRHRHAATSSRSMSSRSRRKNGSIEYVYTSLKLE